MTSEARKPGDPKLEYLGKRYPVLHQVGIIDVFKHMIDINPSVSINEQGPYKLAVRYDVKLGEGSTQRGFRLTALDQHQNIFLYRFGAFYDRLPDGQISMSAKTKDEAEVAISNVLTEDNFFGELEGEYLQRLIQGILTLRGISPSSLTPEKHIRLIEEVYESKRKNIYDSTRDYFRDQKTLLLEAVHEPKTPMAAPTWAERIIDEKTKRERAEQERLTAERAQQSRQKVIEAKRQAVLRLKTEQEEAQRRQVAEVREQERLRAETAARELANKNSQTVRSKLELTSELGIDRNLREIYDDIWKRHGSYTGDVFKMHDVPKKTGGEKTSEISFYKQMRKSYTYTDAYEFINKQHRHENWEYRQWGSGPNDGTGAWIPHVHTHPVETYTGRKLKDFNYKDIGEQRLIRLIYDLNRDAFKLVYARRNIHLYASDSEDSRSVDVDSSLVIAKRKLDSWFMDIAINKPNFDLYNHSAFYENQFLENHKGKIFEEDAWRKMMGDRIPKIPIQVLQPIRD